MDKSFSASHEGLDVYCRDLLRPEDPVLQEIRDRSRQAGLPQIHVGLLDGLHLEVLARLSSAKKAVEIGTLAGYSGVCIARGMGPGGRLWTIDPDRKHLGIAEESFRKAGVSDRVTCLLGTGESQLAGIEKEGPFDLVFVDADKVGYPSYLKWAAKNLKVGGVLIGDNTFAWGMVHQKSFSDPEDEAAAKGIAEFNRLAAQSGWFRATILPTGEGLTVAVKVAQP